MKRITILVALVFWAGIALAQTATPKRPSTPAEQSAVIEKVRDQALSYTRQLPNYICTQRTRQMIQRAVIRQGRVDLIEEQVSFVDNRETRRVVSLNGHPVAADSPDQQHGTASRGEFGNLLEVIFDPQTVANLKWTNPRTLDRRPLYVLSYRVPQSKGYTLTESKQRIQVPYQGFVYADPETLAVVRIEMKITPLDIPKNSEYLNAALTLDYRPEQVAGHEFILPAHYSLHYSMMTGIVFYDAEYTNYRKFSADATIQFEGDKNQ
ncbi:MAG TPA: hypothetical protein VG297_25845 [Bryobacteraceae bacterium]|nr:hypothetical protein [Bryobacteraceae bacterium]